MRRFYSKKHHMTRTQKYGTLKQTEQETILNLIREGNYTCVTLGDGSSIVTLGEGNFHLYFNDSQNLVDVCKVQ